MRESNVRLLFLLVFISVALSACATRTSVITRRNPACSPALESRITIPKRDLRTPELDELGRVVQSEFVRRGVTLVPPAKSEYALSFWIEENWEETPYSKRNDSGLYEVRGSSSLNISGQTTAGRDRLYRKGIRLRLFVSHPKGTNLLETAWEGYVDGGPRMSSKDFGPLVRVLLDHFGQDFVGKVKLDEQGK